MDLVSFDTLLVWLYFTPPPSEPKGSTSGVECLGSEFKPRTRRAFYIYLSRKSKLHQADTFSLIAQNSAADESPRVYE